MSHTSDRLLPPATNHTPLLTLVWLKDNRQHQDARTLVKNMLRHSCGPYGQTATTGGDAELAWGILLPKKFAPLTCWSTYVNGAELCLIEADMYDDLPGLKLQPGDNPALARRVATHMRDYPDQQLDDLNGIYSGVYVNRDRSCAYAFGDLAGIRPVFWFSDQKRFVVTGNLWAFRGLHGFDRRWDNMALMEMLTIGFPMAGRTWMVGVKHMQPGRQVRSYADGRTEICRLLKPVPRQSWSIKHSVRALRDALDQTVGTICRRVAQPVGLALSGGLDSRTLLAALYTQGIDHRSFTFFAGPDEAADNRVAQSAAKLIREQHKTVVLDVALAKALHRDCRLINEGDSPGFGFFLLAAHVQHETSVLFIGFEGLRETAGAFNPLAIKSKHDLAHQMLRSHMTQFNAEQAHNVLADPYRASWKDVLDEWFDSFDQIEQESMLDVYQEHVATYWVIRRTRSRIDPARWFCLPVYPYMDKRVYTTYLRLPLSHVHAEQAPLALLCNYETGLEKLRAAANHFSMPIHKEYRHRHIIQLGRLVKDSLLLPLQQKWQETKGTLGLGRSVLYSDWEADLSRVKDCQLFNGPEVKNIIGQARRGAFVNRNAIDRLIDAVVIDDFLFGPGLSGDRALRFLEPLREIHFTRSNRGSA